MPINKTLISQSFLKKLDNVALKNMSQKYGAFLIFRSGITGVINWYMQKNEYWQ